jgi:rubrerythrin
MPARENTMTEGVCMESLEFERIIGIAVERELEANKFYSQVAERSAEASVREIFSQLAKEEMGHYELLEKYHGDPSMAIKISAPPSDWKVAESQPLPALSITMKPADAIALAMKKEQQAVEFYQNLSDTAGDSQIKDMFKNLANMELGHKHRLETVFVDIGYPEAF